MTDADARNRTGTEIAIVGMAGRFPACAGIAQFWEALRAGKECLTSYTDEDLRAAGVREELLNDPSYVKAGGTLGGVDLFDAPFFGVGPKDAAIMDPQHRHFLECAWSALEHAGHTSRGFPGAIGVFAGCGMNAYFMSNVLSNRDLVESVGLFLLRHTGNDRDFLPTGVSYKLNLRGPSVAVQTACSTSLVAVHLASQSLLGGECDMALAGGVTLLVPHGHGYLYRPNEILSPDGHCRPFDSRSAGTVISSGAGVVVLRRLADAIHDGDTIHAVIRGSAVNNDGAGKVGFLAPSVDGHAHVVTEALELANLKADDLSYVEAHGTGTAVGDPIEIAALTQAFRHTSDRKGFCRIGSVKSNVGHLDTAAGVAGLIKVVEALKHGEIPPSLHFESPNPAIDFANSPFVVNASLAPWTPGAAPRRAGISSLGVGGTNAHVVLEEAPASAPSEASGPWEILPISARTPSALDRATENLAAHLKADPRTSLGDVAFTLQAGREPMEHRRVAVCSDGRETADVLADRDARRVFTSRAAATAPSVVFMFPGGGAQHPGMGRGLYEAYPVFRSELDRCLDLFAPHVEGDLRGMLFPKPGGEAAAAKALEEPCASVCAVFSVEYALAKLWMSWGVAPAAMTGHSLGEYVAACLADVFSLEDIAPIVALRGRLVGTAAGGAMLSVPLPEDEAISLLGDDLDLAAVNAPSMCVISGHADRLREIEARLAEKDLECRRLPLAGASHTRLLEPVLEEFRRRISAVSLREPRIPYVSNVTGTWVRAEDARDPEYWVRHFRRTVRFSQGLAELLRDSNRVFLEVGPGQTLGSLARQQPVRAAGVVSSMRHADDVSPDDRHALTAFARLWATGVDVDWSKVRGEGRRRRIPLPTYPFERQRYWIDAREPSEGTRAAVPRLQRQDRVDDWFTAPAWERADLPEPSSAAPEGPTLIFLDALGLGTRLAEKIRRQGGEVVTVREGDAFYPLGRESYALAPEFGREGYAQLLASLAATGRLPRSVVHLWMVTDREQFRPGSNFFHRNLERGFYSLFFLAQAFGDHEWENPPSLLVASTGAQSVDDELLTSPEKSMILGPAGVIPREFPGVRCRSVDLEPPDPSEEALEKLTDRLLSEMAAPVEPAIVAWRKDVRRAREFRRTEVSPVAEGLAPVRDKAIVLVTGGLGGIGLEVAEHLARSGAAGLILMGRSAFPDRERWDAWLKEHGEQDRVARVIHRIRRLETEGTGVLVASGDVANLESLQGVLEAGRRRFGALHGVIHAAGTFADGVIASKTQDTVERIFTPKIHGTLLLADLLRDVPLDFFLVFASTSSVLCPPGQADYAAANCFLNAFVRSRSGLAPGWKARAVNWGVWRDVGMAAGLARRLRGEDPVEGREPVNHPLLRERIQNGPGDVVFETVYRTKEQWILDEHRTRTGRALVPGTAYLEIARAAVREAAGLERVEIRDLSFSAPLAVGDEESREVRVILSREGDGFGFEVRSRSGGNGESSWEQHARGRIVPAGPRADRSISLLEIGSRCDLPGTPAGTSGQNGLLAFGPRWNAVDSIQLGKGEALARLELGGEFRSDLETYALHPAVLDAATGCGLPLIEGYDEGRALYVPLSYRRVKVHGPLPAKLYSHVRGDERNSIEGDVALFDIAVADESGRVLVEIEQFAVRRITDPSAFAAGTPASASAPPPARSPAEELFLESYDAGIEVGGGMEVLNRILGGTAPPVIFVSAAEFNQVIRRSDAVMAASGESRVRFERPALAQEYVGPRDDLERTLASFWQELLGVDRIGIHDDFFELGGHSLIAVRLFARVRKTWNVEYPVSALFQAPTVARLADLLRSDLGEDAGKKKGSSVRRRASVHRFLVPMNAAGTSGRTPFFLVAGMFGNVMNLRHLAAHLGDEQPMFAIQARGLLGEDRPHTRFEEMASDYLRELKTVQKKGPYLLGGFSGGGITAFEMARQLSAEGERVELLVFLDTSPPNVPEPTRMERLRIQGQRLRRQGVSYVGKWMRNRLAWEFGKLRKLWRKVPPPETPAQFRSEEIRAGFVEALRHYQPQVYSGRVALFRPPLQELHPLGHGRVARDPRVLVDPQNFWSPFIPDGLDIHVVTGDHDSMVLEPHVRVLASRLKRELEAAQKRIAGKKEAAR